MSRTKTNLKIKNSRRPLPWMQILVKLEFLQLKLHSKLKFEELEFLNSGRLQHIFANSGIRPIWPTNFAII